MGWKPVTETLVLIVASRDGRLNRPALSSFLRSDLLEKWHQSPVSAAIYVDEENLFRIRRKAIPDFSEGFEGKRNVDFRCISQYAFCFCWSYREIWSSPHLQLTATGSNAVDREQGLGHISN